MEGNNDKPPLEEGGPQFINETRTEIEIPLWVHIAVITIVGGIAASLIAVASIAGCA